MRMEWLSGDAFMLEFQNVAAGRNLCRLGRKHEEALKDQCARPPSHIIYRHGICHDAVCLLLGSACQQIQGDWII